MANLTGNEPQHSGALPAGKASGVLAAAFGS
jgi:hypothetical protein